MSEWSSDFQLQMEPRRSEANRSPENIKCFPWRSMGWRERELGGERYVYDEQRGDSLPAGRQPGVLSSLNSARD